MAPTPSSEERTDLLATIPADAVAVVVLDPPRRPADSPGVAQDDVTVQLLVQISRQLGSLLDLDESLRAWTDVAASFAQLVRHPIALTLLDIEFSRREDGGHELASMQAALLVDTSGKPEAVEQQIRHLLNTYTNQEHTTLRKINAGEGAPPRYRMTDDRLPAWATVTFGPVGSHYLVTLGEGAADRVLAAQREPSSGLARQSWLSSAARSCRKTGTELRFYADFERLARRQPEGFQARLNTWLNLIDLPGAQRLYAVVSREGRVVEASVQVRQDGADRLIALADHAFLKTWGYELVPSGASVFAVMDARFRTLPMSVWEAYVASRTPATAAALREKLTGIEAKSGVSLRDDVFGRLGNRIVLHDFPLHALRLPVARTIYVPVEREPNLLAEKLDRFLAALAEGDARAGAGASPLRREPDGVWFLDFGLQGPGLKVCGDWLVISYSPFAVRENEKHLRQWGAEAGGRTARPVP